MRRGSSRCLRRSEEWRSRRSRREMSSRGFLRSKNYKENKSLKLIETGRLYYINMQPKSENKFSLKKKKRSKEEQNILRKAENSTRNSNLKRAYSNKSRPKNYKNCTTEEQILSTAANYKEKRSFCEMDKLIHYILIFIQSNLILTS